MYGFQLIFCFYVDSLLLGFAFFCCMSGCCFVASLLLFLNVFCASICFSVACILILFDFSFVFYFVLVLLLLSVFPLLASFASFFLFVQVFLVVFVPFHLEVHITKLIVVCYKNTRLITYTIGLFRSRIL